MTTPVLLWLLFTLLAVALEGFYSAMEMAMVSFNKVRLQYYVSQGSKRAIWLNELLQNPTRLLGTTLLGVNIALLVGSECSRELYHALDLKAELAPLTQVVLVLVCAELAPVFAARRHSVHMAMLGIPFVYASSKVLAPFIWVLSAITRLASRVLGREERENALFLSRDELLTVLEDQSEDSASDTDELNLLVRNIFSLRQKLAGDIMEPINQTHVLSAQSTVAQMTQALKETPTAFFPVYQRSIHHITGIAIPRDYIKMADGDRIGAKTRAPWYITLDTPLANILQQFRTNSQSVAVVLDKAGRAVGIITLYDVLEEIFGKITGHPVAPYPYRKQTVLALEKNIPGDMSIAAFNQQFGVYLDPQGTETFAELMEKVLGHQPAVDESIYVEPFKLTAKRAGLMGAKVINVKTQIG